MATIDQPTVINEAISTGVVRIELLGDKDVARTHTHEARKLTAQLRAMYGVTERIANGESGGFYQHTVELQDGTTMIATTNDGQDSVSILGVGGLEVVVEEVEEKLPKVSYKPGLWVGARYISGGKRSNGSRNSEIHLCLWESIGDEDYNILSNRDLLWPDPQLDKDADEFPLRKNSDIEDTRFEVLEDHTDTDGVEWDVVIRSTEIPRSARYFAKTSIKGDDCLKTTPTTIEVKVIIGDDFGVGRITAKEEITIPTVTRFKYGLMPKGWFGFQFTEDPDSCTDCSIPASDYGENPHGDHWWQGGATAYIPSIQINVAPKDLIQPTIAFDVDDELRTPTGFNFDDEFASRTDRCPACEVERVVMYANNIHVELQHFFERPQGAFPANTSCAGGGSYFRRQETTKKSVVPTGFSQSITLEAGIPGTAVMTGDESGKVITTEMAWDAPVNPPEILNTTDTYESSTGGPCLPVDTWGAGPVTALGALDDAAAVQALQGYIPGEEFVYAHTVTFSSTINSDNDGFNSGWSGYTQLSISEWQANGGSFGATRVSQICTKVMFLDD